MRRPGPIKAHLKPSGRRRPGQIVSFYFRRPGLPGPIKAHLKPSGARRPGYFSHLGQLPGPRVPFLAMSPYDRHYARITPSNYGPGGGGVVNTPDVFGW